MTLEELKKTDSELMGDLTSFIGRVVSAFAAHAMNLPEKQREDITIAACVAAYEVTDRVFKFSEATDDTVKKHIIPSLVRGLVN